MHGSRRTPAALAVPSVALAVLLTLAACASTSVQTSGLPTGPADPTPTAELDPEVAQAIERRLEFGLRADPDYVAAVHADPTSIEHEFGFLVTPDEAADLARRTRAQNDLGALVAYGRDFPDTFGGMYQDQASGGDVVLLFTSEIQRHARAASALAPAGVTVRVERVRFTEAELVAVLETLDFGAFAADGHEMVSAHLDTIGNVVQLDLKTDDATIEDRLEKTYGGRLDVVVYPMPGPWENTASGDGWRLLASGLSRADGYVVRAATDAAKWGVIWAEMGLDGELPEVDFADEVVVSFGHGVGSGCQERRLDDVLIEDDVVYSEVSDPLGPRACVSNLVGGAVFVVALLRSELPADTFTLRLSQQVMPCEGALCTDEIEVDVRP